MPKASAPAHKASVPAPPEQPRTLQEAIVAFSDPDTALRRPQAAARTGDTKNASCRA